jgi:DNA-binding MarR family transcriptional regulator
MHGFLVERAPHAEHGRVIEARLTKGGRTKVQDAHRTVFGIEERMLSEITPAGRRRLNETLRRLTVQTPVSVTAFWRSVLQTPQL